MNNTIEVLQELMTGKHKGSNKPSLSELEGILKHQDVTLLPDGSIIVVRVTDKEKQALTKAIATLKALESAGEVKEELEKTLNIKIKVDGEQKGKL